jgi:hypothetical protein
MAIYPNKATKNSQKRLEKYYSFDIQRSIHKLNLRKDWIGA